MGECYCIECRGPHPEPEDMGWELCEKCNGAGSRLMVNCGACKGVGYVPGPDAVD